MWPHGNLQLLNQAIQRQPTQKTNDIYFYFTLSTCFAERQLCRTELEKRGLVFEENRDYSSYLSHLATHRFAICPPGNGVDSHRLWECYYLGVIPIVIKNTFTELVHQHLPCIVLSSWSDFDKNKIIPKYQTLLQQLYSKHNLLTMQHHQSEIRRGPVRTVWFHPRGRTGNNIFQYMAAEVIKHIYNFDVVRMAPSIPSHCHVIADQEYRSICNDYLACPRVLSTPHTNIALNGYFQHSPILLALRPIIRPLFNPFNMIQLNDSYKVCDFSEKNTIHQHYHDKNALVLHLRLDDFIHLDNPPEIFDNTKLGDILDKLTFSRLYIVCDVLRADWERKYVQYFMDRYPATLVTGSMLDDFHFMKNSNRLFTSPSTFSWLAAYLGDASEVHIPYSNYHKENQVLAECHDHCIVHYDIPFSSSLNV